MPILSIRSREPENWYCCDTKQWGGSSCSRCGRPDPSYQNGISKMRTLQELKQAIDDLCLRHHVNHCYILDKDLYVFTMSDGFDVILNPTACDRDISYQLWARGYKRF